MAISTVKGYSDLQERKKIKVINNYCKYVVLVGI